jgi:DNA-binding CsgD family transcriptional regulator
MSSSNRKGPAISKAGGGSTAPEDVQLTPRELECLQWTMQGKTAWEVGKILGISEQTAARHLNNATRKLDCTSKHQAVLKALRLGLIG